MNIIFGETHVSNEGYNIVVVKGSDKSGHVVVSIDGKYEKTVVYSDLVKGEIKNLYHKSVFGKGYVGIGKHKVSLKGVVTKKYNTWFGMLQRYYSSDLHIKRPTYKDVTVCEDWHNFQVFGDWYDTQYKEEGWQLDKDLLSRGEKIYSPETCVFIPRELNSFLTQDKGNIDHPTGVYRKGSRYYSEIRCLLSGRSLYLGMFDTIAEADLAYRNKRLVNMIVWLRRIRNNLNIDYRVYEGMEVIYEEYKKERDDLRERIVNNLSVNKQSGTKFIDFN